MPSISMNFLLENKLGVCRDYAKLTACLLLNIYPNAEIYFGLIIFLHFFLFIFSSTLIFVEPVIDNKLA